MAICKKRKLSVLVVTILCIASILFCSTQNVDAAAQKIGIGKASNLVTRDYTFVGRAVDTFNWQYDAKTNRITKSSAKQECYGIKQISIFRKKSIMCTKRTSTAHYYTSIYYLSLPRPIKALGSYKFATITVKYELSAKKLKVLSRQWKWSLVEKW